MEQELLNLPEKMSSPKVLMGFILLDLQFPVSWGGKSRYFSGQLFKNFTGPLRQLIFFLKSTPVKLERDM